MKVNNSPLVYLLILNYRGYEDTCECIESLLCIEYNNYRLLVIDNNSEDGSYEKLQQRYPDIEHIQTGKNLGYAGGNNVGIMYALEKEAQYIAILNNDIRVESNFLNIMIHEMEENRKIAISGPTVCEWNSDVVQSAGAMVNLYTAESKLLNSGKNYSEINSKKIICDYVSGACIIVRASLLNVIGKIPEIYFLFYEETEWCIQTARKGYEICCIPSARIWHKESSSVNKISDLKQYYMDRNRVVFEKRNAGMLQFLFFNNYIILQTIFRKITKKNQTAGFKALWDGLQYNKICESQFWKNKR